eukprot:jgi/Chlat1/1416/Chrsp12S02061
MPLLLVPLLLRPAAPPVQPGAVESGAVLATPVTDAETDALTDSILASTRASGTEDGINVVAFSGGVDSSLTAWMVHQAFPLRSVACIARSASLAASQLELARKVASHIGMDLRELDTREGELEGYIANEGESCYHCKTTLYSTLSSIVSEFNKSQAQHNIVLFNGTNADDLRDPTRLGLIAAKEYSVASPLARLPKSAVRMLAKRVGLSNWDLAASPCLRSRLAYGVQATLSNLQLVEEAEDRLKVKLGIEPTEDFRVRMLAGNVAIVEVCESRLRDAERRANVVAEELSAVGLASFSIKPFRTGSLSLHGGYQTAVADRTTTLWR